MDNRFLSKVVKESIAKETLEYSTEGVRGVDGRTFSRQGRVSLKVLPESREVGAMFTECEQRADNEE